MDAINVAALVFVGTFGGSLVGMWSRTRLPEHHLAEDSKVSVKVCMGLIATMTALVLGLVTAAAKSSFESVAGTVRDSAAEIITLDRTLARIGPQSQAAREALYEAITTRLDVTWPRESTDSELMATHVLEQAENVVSLILDLSPLDEEGRRLQAQALDLGEGLLESRWVLLTGVGGSVLAPFVIALVFWLTVTFVSFGLFAPYNVTSMAALVLSSMSVAGAVFLVLELDGPFAGVITVSPEPLRFALAWMEQ
jgi:hypothetical protein